MGSGPQGWVRKQLSTAAQQSATAVDSATVHTKAPVGAAKFKKGTAASNTEVRDGAIPKARPQRNRTSPPAQVS